MSQREEWDLDGAVVELERLAHSRGTPTHITARSVLIPLGLELVDRGEDPLLETLARVQAATEDLGEAWRRAALAELELAASEHVQAVNPRYLDLPNYDFAYTAAARERLEARLRAFRALGYRVAPELLERVAAADALLRPYLER